LGQFHSCCEILGQAACYDCSGGVQNDNIPARADFFAADDVPYEFGAGFRVGGLDDFLVCR